MVAMVPTLPDPAIDKPPQSRRSIPLSLRIFAAILVLIGLASTWRCVQAFRQVAAIHEIRRIGGCVFDEPVGPTWLRQLVGFEQMRGFDNVTAIVLEENATDSALSQIGGFQSLKCLWLRDTQITNAGLAHLKNLKGLEYLNLAKSKVDAEGLDSLVGLSKLKVIWLDETQLNDESQQLLGKIPGLRLLVVENIELREPDDYWSGYWNRREFDREIIVMKSKWLLANARDIEEWIIRWPSSSFNKAFTVIRFPPSD